jgi:hypothetical protein
MGEAGVNDGTTPGWGMRSRNLIGIVVLLIPLAFMVAWHLGNHALPADDAANHAEVALRISREFRQGMLHGVAAILDVRGWRPIAFAPLSVPFLLLTDGNVVAASAATLGCLLVAVTFYLYRLVRLFSDDSLVSSVTTATVVSMPVVFAYSLVFFSELAWILFSIAFVYHLLRSGSISVLAACPGCGAVRRADDGGQARRIRGHPVCLVAIPDHSRDLFGKAETRADSESCGDFLWSGFVPGFVRLDQRTGSFCDLRRGDCRCGSRGVAAAILSESIVAFCSGFTSVVCSGGRDLCLR